MTASRATTGTTATTDTRDTPKRDSLFSGLLPYSGAVRNRSGGRATMSRLRWCVAIAVLAATAPAVPSSAAPAVAFGGTTVLVASRPVWADVRVPRAATFRTPFGESPDIAVSGGERLVAFALVGRDRSNAAVTIVGGAAHGERFLFPVRDHPAPAAGTFETVKTYPDVVHLPAGNYRVYVMTAWRATITLRLNGLSGHATIAPSRAAKAEIAAPDETVDTPTRNTYAATSTRVLAGRGLALQALRSRIEVSAAWQLVMCHRPKADDNPVTSSPGCPSADDRTLVNHRAPDVADAKFFVHGYAGLPAGPHGLGTYFATQGYVTSLDYAALWLTYS